MQKLEATDLMSLEQYARERPAIRAGMIEHRRRRQLKIGENCTWSFEDRRTVQYQIQEMLRAERIADLDKIREEIEVYNELIPGRDELSATLFLEIEDQSHLREDLLKFLGIDEAVSLKIGGRTVPGKFEEGRSKEDKISAVQYVRFPFDAEARAAFLAGASAELVIDHPNYHARAVLTPEAQKSLAEDLAA